ncbi:MAG: hypothetical protein WA269_13595, partial [Candidatus Udaeobacter sp.]
RRTLFSAARYRPGDNLPRVLTLVGYRRCPDGPSETFCWQAIIIGARRHSAKEGRDIGGILPLTQNPIVNRHSALRRRTIMKLKKLKKKIQQLEKRLREGPEKLASLKRKLQQAESAKALKAARRSAVRATAAAGKKSSETTTGTRKPKRKLNLSPERRAQLAAAMKARWAAKRAAEGNSTTSSDQNSPTPPTQPPENRVDGF